MFNSRVGGRLKEDVDGKHRARENPPPREMTEKFIDSFIFCLWRSSLHTLGTGKLSTKLIFNNLPLGHIKEKIISSSWVADIRVALPCFWPLEVSYYWNR